MSKAPERIWGLFDQFGHGSTMLREISQCQNLFFDGPKPTEYIRADLVEAAVKRALEGAASVAKNAYLVPPGGSSPIEDEEAVCRAAAEYIRALDPAQFVDGADE